MAATNAFTPLWLDFTFSIAAIWPLQGVPLMLQRMSFPIVYLKHKCTDEHLMRYRLLSDCTLEIIMSRFVCLSQGTGITM